MKKIIVFFLILLISTGISYSQIDYDSCILKVSKQQLIDELAGYSKFWIKDSLAKNGFRHFFGREFFRCSDNNLKGLKWSTISSYLGPPHFTVKSPKKPIYSKDEMLYRYVLHTYGDYRNYEDVGNIILDVIVIYGIIKKVSVYDVDG
jgi:hypothetical protein